MSRKKHALFARASAAQVYLSDDPNGEVHWELDAKHGHGLRRRAPTASETNAIFKDLATDGVALVADFGLGRDALDDLERAAATALSGETSDTLSITSDGASRPAPPDKTNERMNEVASKSREE